MPGKSLQQETEEDSLMARVTKHTCDRCGKPIKYSGWTALIFRPKKIKIRQILNGNPSGYAYTDYDWELCRECTKALDKFVFGGGSESTPSAEWNPDGFCTNCHCRAEVQSIGFNCTGGTRIEYKQTKFCPNCGFRMNGVDGRW